MRPDLPQGVPPWSEPRCFEAGDASAAALERLVDDGLVRRVVDPLDVIARALVEHRDPAVRADRAEVERRMGAITSGGDAVGVWWWFPWSGDLVRYPAREDHRAMRTARFRHLLTTAEQARLFAGTVYFAGLSIGSKVVEACVENGVAGTLVLADFDVIEPSNTGRLSATNASLGESKLSWLAKRISEKDPWLAQVHQVDGADPDRLPPHVRPDVVVEEVDSIPVKARLRLWARDHGVPLVTAADIHDRSVIDVERYDTQPGRTRPFLGRLPAATVAELAAADSLDPAAATRAMIRHSGVRDASARMLRTMRVVGREVGGLPQLGTTASLGGVELTWAVREILLGGGPRTGRYRACPRDTFRMGAQEGVRAWAAALARLLVGTRRA